MILHVLWLGLLLYSIEYLTTSQVGVVYTPCLPRMVNTCVLECTALLHANSNKGKNSAQYFGYACAYLRINEMRVRLHLSVRAICLKMVDTR